MTRTPARLGALLCALGLVACGSDPQDTTSTTQSLLGSTGATARDLGSAGASTDLSEVAPPPGLVGQEEGRINIAALGFNIGNEEAPLRVLEMSDFGCGFCKRFHDETWPVLFREFVATGKVQWKFVPFVNGMFRNSTAVTEAAECTLQQGPAIFANYSERLWAEQSEWKGSLDPEGVARQYAEGAGADLGTYDACLADDSGLGRVAASTTLSQQLGVRGTPTFYVIGFTPIQGALPTELFVEMLDAAYQLAISEGESGGGSGSGNGND